MPPDPLQLCNSMQLLSCSNGLRSHPAHSQICCDAWTLHCWQVPIIGFIGRLDYQKGADLVLGAAHWLLNQDVQIICLGTGDKHLEVMLIIHCHQQAVLSLQHCCTSSLQDCFVTYKTRCTLSWPSFVNMRGLYTLLEIEIAYWACGRTVSCCK